MSVTARSILSSALVGESPYNQAERVLAKLDAAGWEIVRKPRTPEPTGFAPVVEAGVEQHDERLRWVQNHRGYWVCEDRDEYDRLWSELVDPVLVRDGIEESS